MTKKWSAGNAEIDSKDSRGWLVGHFIDKGSIRASSDVEIKWGVHPAGERRDVWSTSETRTAVLLLVSGRFRFDMRDHSVVLEGPGDYVMWGPGVDHMWQAEEASIVITIRWPSAEQA